MTLAEEIAQVRALLDRLELQALSATCSEVGHKWRLSGGRNAACIRRDCYCSVSVYTCSRCGECDYGDNNNSELDCCCNNCNCSVPINECARYGNEGTRNCDKLSQS